MLPIVLLIILTNPAFMLIPIKGEFVPVPLQVPDIPIPAIVFPDTKVVPVLPTFK